MSAAVFFATGVLFAYRRRANRRTATALAASERANEDLSRARAQVQRAREALAALIEHAPDGVFVANIDGRYTEVNGAACRMLGYRRDELIGRSIVDLIPSDRTDQLAREKEQMLAGRDQISEWTLRCKDGSELPVEVSATILADGRWQAFVRDISARKQLEGALHAIRSDLERAQSVAKVASWRWDFRSNELRWSDENYRIFGIAPGTRLNYETFWARVHPDDRAYVEREWTAALGGRPYDIEHRIVVDGATKWVREKAEIEFDQDHALVGGIGITADITDRKHYEQALREAQERHELALRGADLGAWDWNIETGAVIYSPRWAEMRGFRPDEIEGHIDAWTSGIHPEDWPRVQARLADYFEGRVREYESEHRARTKSGEWVWLLDRGKVFARDAAGRPIRMVGTELDITARKRADAELRLAEAQASFLSEFGALLASTLELEDTLASIGQLVTHQLADACVVYVIERDGQVRRTKAVVRDRAQDWICEELMRAPVDRTKWRDIWAELEANRPVLLQDITPAVLRSLAQDEHHLSILRALDPRSIIAVPLFAHGRLVGAMALISSTSSRINDPGDVRFAEIVAQRAAFAIENAQLYAEARQAIQTRDEVLGIVAHDLRNPLTSILIQVEHLRRDPDRDRLGKSVDAIDRSATRMRRLIQDLLDVARLEKGPLSVDQVRISVPEIAAYALEAQQQLATANALQLRLEIAEDLPDVWADRDRLLQILENLIGNAIKFTEPGGIVRIGARRIDGDVLFWVADTGTGISVGHLPRVFDPFWQAQKGGRHGAGLGLPIVKGLVDAHGGRVWVDSTLGRGTTFFFTLPTASQPSATVAAS